MQIAVSGTINGCDSYRLIISRINEVLPFSISLEYKATDNIQGKPNVLSRYIVRNIRGSILDVIKFTLKAIKST